MPKKDRRADILVGRARMSGYEVKQLAKKSGISVSTFYRRLKNPGDFTLRELYFIDKLIGLTDEELVYLVKKEGRR